MPTDYWILATHPFDFFRVEWERAAWTNAGSIEGEEQAKRGLVLGELTGEVQEFEKAVAARPDLPTSRFGLGCALAMAGRVAEAVAHFREAVWGNPFDLRAARALYQALKDSGDVEGCRGFGRGRQLLAKAAPRIVPVEAWFYEDPSFSRDPSGSAVSEVTSERPGC